MAARDRTMTWVAVAMAVAFLTLAIIVRAYPRNAIDTATSHAVQRAVVLDSFMHAASALGGRKIPVLLAVTGIIALFAVRARLEALCLAASGIGAIVIEKLTSFVLARPRPTAPIELRDVVRGWSFPSGHVTAYVAIFGFLAVIAWVRIPTRALRTVATSAALLLVAFVGPSRVYLGAHWATDVLGAYLGIGAWVVVVARFYLRSHAARSNRDDPPTL